MAKNQLEADVNLIKSINKDRKKFNELVMAVAKNATGKDGGQTPKEWRQTLAAGNGISKQPSRTPEKPTFGEMVSLAYNPVFAPVGFTASVRDQDQRLRGFLTGAALASGPEASTPKNRSLPPERPESRLDHR